jgi:hypothetical protein
MNKTRGQKSHATVPLAAVRNQILRCCQKRGARTFADGHTMYNLQNRISKQIQSQTLEAGYEISLGNYVVGLMQKNIRSKSYIVVPLNPIKAIYKCKILFALINILQLLSYPKNHGCEGRAHLNHTLNTYLSNLLTSLTREHSGLIILHTVS